MGRRATAQTIDPPNAASRRSEPGPNGTRTADLSSAQLGHGFHGHDGRPVAASHCVPRAALSWMAVSL